MASRTFGSGASSLLKSAVAAQNKENAYNDQLQAYQFELSPKTQSDYQAYQTYLKNRQAKETDPSKALTLQKTITSADRSFNSAEIQRASMAVNYGDMSKTDKYNQMNGLLNAAVQNGDMNLAQNIESQMGSLSISIQNDAQTAANNAASAGKAASSAAYGATTTKLNDLQNKLDLAYQTGQPVTTSNGTKEQNAGDYALNTAWVLNQRHALLATKAAEDPSYADNLSQLEKSPEYKGLIGSGMVQFDQAGHAIATPGIDNLAVNFAKDKYGNTYRTFSPVPVGQNGKTQVGLVQQAPGSNATDWVVNHKLSDQPGSAMGHVLYSSQKGADINGNDTVPAVSSTADKNIRLIQDPLGFAHGKQVGTQLLGDTNTGLRASVTAENGNVAAAKQDLKNLSNPTTYQDPGLIPDALSALGTSFSNQSKSPLSSVGSAIGSLSHFDLGKEVANLAHPNLASTGTGIGGMVSNVLDSLFHRNTNKVLTDEQNAKIAAAKAAAQAQAQAQLDAFNRQATAQYQANQLAQQRAQSIALQKAAQTSYLQPSFNPMPQIANPQQTAPAKNLQPTVGGTSLQGGGQANIIARF